MDYFEVKLLDRKNYVVYKSIVSFDDLSLVIADIIDYEKMSGDNLIISEVSK